MECLMGNTRTVAPDQIQAATGRIIEASNRVPRGAQALVTAVNQALDDLRLAVNQALDDLQLAVDEARLLGVDRETIEEALDVWRGAVSAELTGSDVEPVASERVAHTQHVSDQLSARRGHTAFQPSHRSPAVH
jgi:hypothetical protein